MILFGAPSGAPYVGVCRLDVATEQLQNEEPASPEAGFSFAARAVHDAQETLNPWQPLRED
jgi:hypothetical protein